MKIGEIVTLFTRLIFLNAIDNGILDINHTETESRGEKAESDS